MGTFEPLTCFVLTFAEVDRCLIGLLSGSKVDDPVRTFLIGGSFIRGRLFSSGKIPSLPLKELSRMSS
jgi:hypothetical protein